MLPNSEITGADKMAELLRLSLEKKKIDFQGSQFNFTASFGISSLSKEQSIEQLIDKADRALYQAKKLGKNRVERF